MEGETIQTQAEVQGTGEASVPVEIEYATVSQLNTVLERINAGERPSIVDTPVLNTWIVRFEGTPEVILLNVHQLAVVQAAIDLRATPIPGAELGSENPSSDAPEGISFGGVSFITLQQMSAVLAGIRTGNIPEVLPSPIPSVWQLRYGEHQTFHYINQEQFSVISAAINIFTQPGHPSNGPEEETTGTGDSPLTAEEQRLLDETINSIHREIPENSPTLSVDETTVRFSSAVWYDRIKEQHIMLAGCGGIGSWTGLLLARLQPDRLFLYDPDTVEAVNMAGQLYETAHFGELKVSSLANVVQRFSSFNRVFTVPDRYSLDKGTSNVMICGFDNMEARATFFDAWCLHVNEQTLEHKRECLFLDGRLAAEEFQVLCIRGDDVYNIDRYRKEFLFSDAEAEETVCSYKQTSFMANMIASVMVNLFVNFTANLCNPVVPRDLPFLTSYSAELMYFKTEV